MSNGLFVTFEGVDGCGKSTQWQAVAVALRQHYPEKEILQTRNPGGTKIGQAIRTLLLSPQAEGDAPMASMSELLLYMADRAQHVEEVLTPALARGAIVLCDRFVDSSIAYQGAARGIEADLILQLNRFACGDLHPHLTLLFDGDVKKLAKRVKARGNQDRLELEGLAFQEKVRQGFLALAQREPTRVHRLDAFASIESLTAQAVDLIMQKSETAQAADDIWKTYFAEETA
jgi:dTMP kinase